MCCYRWGDGVWYEHQLRWTLKWTFFWKKRKIHLSHQYFSWKNFYYKVHSAHGKTMEHEVIDIPIYSHFLMKAHSGEMVDVTMCIQMWIWAKCFTILVLFGWFVCSRLMSFGHFISSCHFVILFLFSLHEFPKFMTKTEKSLTFRT